MKRDKSCGLFRTLLAWNNPRERSYHVIRSRDVSRVCSLLIPSYTYVLTLTAVASSAQMEEGSNQPFLSFHFVRYRNIFKRLHDAF